VCRYGLCRESPSGSVLGSPAPVGVGPMCSLAPRCGGAYRPVGVTAFPIVCGRCHANATKPQLSARPRRAGRTPRPGCRALAEQVVRHHQRGPEPQHVAVGPGREHDQAPGVAGGGLGGGRVRGAGARYDQLDREHGARPRTSPTTWWRAARACRRASMVSDPAATSKREGPRRGWELRCVAWRVRGSRHVGVGFQPGQAVQEPVEVGGGVAPVERGRSARSGVGISGAPGGEHRGHRGRERP
jgi:hypothetical protein